MIASLIQLKFLPIKMRSKMKKSLMVQLFLFFSISSVNHCYAVTVGDSYGGGTVFCVSQTPDITQCLPEGSGDYGLIMANEDQDNYDSNHNHGITWSSAYSVIPNAQSEDNGAANTLAIITAFPHDNPSNNAAWLSYNYRDQEEHTDWYLPAQNELNKIYIYVRNHNLIGKGCSGSKAGGVQCLVGGAYNSYWSSTEFCGNGNYAHYQYFSKGSRLISNKINEYHGVRAIRVFNNLTVCF